MIASINPFSGEVLKEFSSISANEISEKILYADNAFKHWRKTSFDERKKLMLNLANELLSHKAEHSKLISLEMGKLIVEAGLEIEKCARMCRYYAENAEEFLANEIIETDAAKSFIAYEPMGVVLGVMPWNFPFWQVLRFAVPSIMTGNVILLKHASNVPQCAIKIEELFISSGFPKNIFQTLIINAKEVASVIENPVVKAVSLTGSEEAGSHVAAIAGKHIKKAVLELGGSDAFIVFEDADMKIAVENAAKSRLGNDGQSCIAAKRFIVSEKIIDEFTQLLKEKFLELKKGNPLDNDTQIGVMAREDLAIELEHQMNKSIALGAQLICGGNRERAFFEPTILSDVKPGMPAFDEELFGPIAPIISFTTEEEAIELANNSTFGLGGSIWLKDVEKGLKLAAQVESGSVYVNTLMKSDQRLPFGGTKKSGFGRELGRQGIHEFVNVKSVMVN